MTGFKNILSIFFLLGSTCSSCQPEITNNTSPQAQNILIVYLSRTHNTKAVASIIHECVGGTLLQLELKNPYPEEYKAIVEQVAKENESGFLPPLKTSIENIKKYDVIFVGFPTWGMQLPPPMKSFLQAHDLSNKIVVPFNTNAGYGVGSGFDTVKQLCPNSKVLEGISFKGGIERDGIYFVMEGEKKERTIDAVKDWLNKIKIAP